MPSPVYRFTLESFQVFDTRARHQDTDYVSFGLSPAGGKARVATKFMGNLGNGVYPVGLTFDNQPVGSNQFAFLHYLIVNAGSATPASFEADLASNALKVLSTASETAAKDLVGDLAGDLAEDGLEALFTTLGVDIGAALGTAVLPLVGSAVGLFAGWLIGKIAGLIDPDCDGVVAAELTLLSGRDLWSKTATGPYKVSTNQVLDGSPDGCHTSNYTVNWSVERSVRSTISALSLGGGGVQVFGVGQDGRVQTQWAWHGEDWNASGWQPVSDGVFSRGTTVGAMFDKAGVMHLFAVGKDGRVYTQWSKPGEAWYAGGWIPLTGAVGLFNQGTTVTPLLDDGGVMHLFAVGNDGRVYTQWSKPGEAWNAGGWAPVSTGVFTQGTAVSALLDNAGVMHLFAVGENGGVYTQWSKPFEDWQKPDWVRISDGVFTQGATVTALLDGAGVMHLFAVGLDGHVFTQWSRPGEAWQEPHWVQVSDGVFNQCTTVTALLDSAGVMHLFAVGEDGHVFTQWSRPGEAWYKGGWVQVSSGVFTQGTTATALNDTAGVMHLFAVGEDDHVFTQWSKPGEDWRKPDWVRISDTLFG